jgi:hypothetical protein
MKRFFAWLCVIVFVITASLFGLSFVRGYVWFSKSTNLTGQQFHEPTQGDGWKFFFSKGGVKLERYCPGWEAWYSSTSRILKGHLYYPYIVSSLVYQPEDRFWEIRGVGFQIYSKHLSKTEEIRASWYWGIVVPIWFFLLFELIPFLIAVRYLRHCRLRKNRLRKGLCANCGYDLRASPINCPECGTVHKTIIATT